MLKYIPILGLSFSILFLLSLKDEGVKTYELVGKVSCNNGTCSKSVGLKMTYKNYISREIKEKTTSTDPSSGSFRFTYKGKLGDTVTIIANDATMNNNDLKCQSRETQISITPKKEYFFYYIPYKTETVEIENKAFSLDCERA